MKSTNPLLDVTSEQEPVALRLLSALIANWHLLPLATRELLAGYAAEISDSAPGAVTSEEAILAFVDRFRSSSPREDNVVALRPRAQRD